DLARDAEVEVDGLRSLCAASKVKGGGRSLYRRWKRAVYVRRGGDRVQGSVLGKRQCTCPHDGESGTSLASKLVATCARIPVPAIVARLLKIDIGGVACAKRIVDSQSGRKLRSFDRICWIKGRHRPSSRVVNERGCGVKAHLDRGVSRLLRRKGLSGDIDVFDERQRVARTIDIKTLDDQ